MLASKQSDLSQENWYRRYLRHRGRHCPKASARHGRVLSAYNRAARRVARQSCRAHLGTLPAEVTEALEDTPHMGTFHAKGWRRRRRNRRR